jgi:two-component system cell cycle sensor histidine kinase PleC
VARYLSQEMIDGGSSHRLNAVTLRFEDPAIERRFNVDHLLQALPMLRLTLLGATAIYAGFGILDSVVIPDAQAIAAWIRYAVVGPALLGTILLSYTKFFPKIAQLLLSAAMLLSGLGIVAMTAWAADPGKTTYYAGLILVIIIGSSVVPIRWMAVTLVSTTIFAAYQFVASQVNPIPGLMLLNNDFFLSAAVLAGISASYLQELKLRRIFIRDEGLRIAREQSDELRIRAETASNAKSEFLAVMSHELRTPLNAILGFTEIMKLRLFGALGSERYTCYVEDIHESAKHLLNIVTDILDHSKAEVGKLQLEEAPIELVPILDECLRLMRGWAGEEGVRLTFSVVSADAPGVYGDARLVKQVFFNLLSNAIKFTPAGGTVSVSLEAESDGRLSVKFTDTGIGIAESDLSSVLEPFVQIESAFARKHGGTGLGLPLVKRIMNLHDGDLSLASKLGAGTTATVWFPAERILRAMISPEPEARKVSAR